MLYVLDRGHGLQAPCGESGSDCGFSAGFAGLQTNDSRSRSRGNVGIPAGISKGCGKGGKPALWLSMLSTPRHFHGCFWVKSQIVSFGEIRRSILDRSWLGEGEYPVSDRNMWEVLGRFVWARS